MYFSGLHLAFLLVTALIWGLVAGCIAGMALISWLADSGRSIYIRKPKGE